MASLIEVIARLLTAAPWVFVILGFCAICLIGSFSIGKAFAVHSIAKYLTQIIQIVLTFIRDMKLMKTNIDVYREIKINEAKNRRPENASDDDSIKHLLKILPLQRRSNGSNSERGEAKGTSTANK